MVAKNKHHIQKQHGPKPWGMGFSGDSSISSRKIITIKIRQNLGHFDTKKIKVKETVCKAFYSQGKRFTPKGHYFAHRCGKRPFSLSVNGARTRILHTCVE